MFDVGRLRVVCRTQPENASFSFVGIRRNPADGRRELWTPQGFEQFPVGNYQKTVQLFFSLYRVFLKFKDQNALRDDKADQSRDPLSEASSGGHSHSIDVAADQLTFARLARLDRVMRTFDEAMLRSLVTRSLPRVPSSLERLHLSLDKALFNDDHSFSLPETRQPVQTLQMYETDLMQLACFVYGEVLSWTYGPSSVPAHVRQAGGAFKETHLQRSAGLFVEGAFEDVLIVLRRELHAVYKRSAYRDEDFWDVFEAVETFLYGDLDFVSDDGIEWGITDFHKVWEGMCHAFAERVLGEEGRTILFADTSPRVNVFTDGGPFVLRWGATSRRLAPDLVARDDFEFVGWLARRLTVRIDAHPVSHLASVRVDRETESAEVWFRRLRRILKKAATGYRCIDISPTAFRFNNLPQSLVDHALAELKAEAEADVMKRRQAYVIDFKYLPPSAFGAGELSTKAEDDIRKSLVYELALTGRDELGKATIRNQLIVPAYFDVAAGERAYAFLNSSDDVAVLSTPWTPHPTVKEAKIDVIAVSFMDAVEDYAPLIV